MIRARRTDDTPALLRPVRENPGKIALFGAGAGIMFFLDPDRGRRRRALVRDQLLHYSRLLGRPGGVLRRDLTNRTMGTLAELRAADRRRPSRVGRPEYLQEYWSPTARLFAGAAGCAALIYGLGRRDLWGGAVALGGTALTIRALANEPLQRITGVGAGRNAVTIQKDINIDVPVERAFALWSNYENFPMFMSHVREVRETADGRSHWVVEGPAGVPIEWDAEITKVIPNRMLAWKTETGSPIQHSGIVRFDATDTGGTRVEVRLSYNPVLGEIGHTVASLFQGDPKAQMDDDLMRMKSFMETHHPPADAAAAA